MNNAYYNNMYNWSYIQQQAQLYNQYQAEQIAECVRKFDDLLTTMERVSPEYQSAALAAICAAYVDHVNRNNRMG